MTTHPSLRGVNTLVGARSVLTRVERIQALEKDQKLDPSEDSAYGLPKVRTHFKVAKKPKDGEEDGAAEAGSESEGDAEASDSDS